MHARSDPHTQLREAEAEMRNLRRDIHDLRRTGVFWKEQAYTEVVKRLAHLAHKGQLAPEIVQQVRELRDGNTAKVLPRPRIVSLCGSTRFAAEFNREAARLTLEGLIIVRPEVVTYSAESDPQHVAPKTKADLDHLHLRKIDLADEVYILNVGGYIGESSMREIAYAIATKKRYSFLEPSAGEDFLERNSHKMGQLVAGFFTEER